MAQIRQVPTPGQGLGPLRWVAAEPAHPKVLVWDRDRDEWWAGAGAAAVYAPKGPTTTEAIERELVRRAAAEPVDGPGWIGGIRFAVEREPGPAWAAFGAGVWIRPRTWWVRRDGAEVRGEDPERLPAAAQLALSDAGPLQGEPPDAYLARVTAALRELQDSPLEKIVLARCVHRAGTVDPAKTLLRMAATEPGGTLYWIALDPEQGFFGLTPETLYRRRGREVETEALAGTSGPGAAAGAALRRDPKSLREHAYVRDAIVGALGPLADRIAAAPEPGLHPLARLQHLRTPISAHLVEPRPLLSRLHPTPAVCGTPYAEAEAAIARLEAVDRGLYSGAVGWFGRDGESIHVALRGARYSRGGCIAHLGAGIVAGSIPEAELRELGLKAAALFGSFTGPGNGVAR